MAEPIVIPDGEYQLPFGPYFLQVKDGRAFLVPAHATPTLASLTPALPAPPPLAQRVLAALLSLPVLATMKTLAPWLLAAGLALAIAASPVSCSSLHFPAPAPSPAPPKRPDWIPPHPPAPPPPDPNPSVGQHVRPAAPAASSQSAAIEKNAAPQNTASVPSLAPVSYAAPVAPAPVEVYRAQFVVPVVPAPRPACTTGYCR